MSRSKPYRWIFYFLAIMALTLTARAQENHTVIPPFLKRSLQRDAARLCLRAIGDTIPLENALIEIPVHEQQKYFSLLSNLYLQNPTAKALLDCRVKTGNHPQISSLQIVLTDTATFNSENIYEPNTDWPGLDSFILTHQLHIEGIAHWNARQDMLQVLCRKPINAPALAKQIKALDGVAEVVVPSGTQALTDITVEKHIEGWKVQLFLFEPPAAIPTFSWTFFVNEEGRVTKEETSGNTVPGWFSCSLPSGP